MSNATFEFVIVRVDINRIWSKHLLNIIKQCINWSLKCMIINLQFLIASPYPRIEIFEVALSFRHQIMRCAVITGDVAVITTVLPYWNTLSYRKVNDLPWRACTVFNYRKWLSEQEFTRAKSSFRDKIINLPLLNDDNYRIVFPLKKWDIFVILFCVIVLI